MKINNIKSFLALAVVLFFFNGCADDDKLPVDFEDLNAETGAFATEVSADGSTNINRLAPAASEFSKTYELFSRNKGTDVNSVSVYVSFTGENVTADEELYKTIDASTFNPTGNETPEVTIEYNGQEILSALGISPDNLEGGDIFSYRLALTTPDGVFSDVSANFDNQSADHTFTSTIICELPEVPAGDWVVEMKDSYGDGWQTDDANGGSGITVTLSTGDVIEVGLCSPYQASDFDCTDGASSGTAIVTIPGGVESAEWVFPGDFYGEISFDIYSPSGNLVASYPAGSPAGPIALNLCNE